MEVDIHLQTAKTVFSHLNNLHSFVEVLFTSFGFIFADCLVRSIWFIFTIDNDCLVKVLGRFKLFLGHNGLQQSTNKAPTKHQENSQLKQSQQVFKLRLSSINYHATLKNMISCLHMHGIFKHFRFCRLYVNLTQY